MAPRLWNLLRQRKPKKSRRWPLVVTPLEERLLLSGGPPPFILNLQGTATPVAGFGYTPAQIRQVYGFSQISGLSGNNYNAAGSGQTIAIIDYGDAPTVANDLQQFDEYFHIGGAANNPASMSFFTVVNQDGGTPSTQAGYASAAVAAEQDMTVEWAHAIAPGANILLVEADDSTYADQQTAVLYAASQPAVSVVCMISDYTEGTTPDAHASVYTTPVGHQGVAFVAMSGDAGAPPTGPSADPNVLAVGGTTLPANASGNPNLAAETGWSGSGGGIVPIEPQPTYQQGIVTQSTTNRTTPDVAYEADPTTGFVVYDSDSNQPSLPWYGSGGTGAAAAQWAALVAIADQERVAAGETTLDGPSQLLPALYQISQTISGAFNDITTGASTGTPGYSAGDGYDLVTGVGTPNAQVLVPALVSAFATPALPNTIYWTGDAGKNDAGNYDWDQPGNWSTFDPKVANVPMDILPGPSDNVVIDLVGANITHSDATYDTISSLTVAAPNVTLNLTGGTLDLSGSGADGTFDVPGTINVSTGQYGNVHLNGGVLANANVTKDTAIGVLPSANEAASLGNSGRIDGGVLNGTIQLIGGGFTTLDMAGKWVNNGTITADGGYIILGDFWSAGLGDAGASQDAWVNNGTISTKNSTVDLGGWLTYDPSVKNLATLDLSTATTVSLIGTLDNTAADNPAQPSVLTLNPGVTSNSGSWDMLGGRIDQGSLATTGGAELDCGPVFSGSATGTLDGVSIAIGAVVQVSSDASLTFEGQGWTNSGSITVSDTATLNLFGSWTNFGNMIVGSGMDATSTVSLGTPINIAPTSAAAANYAWADDGTIAIPDTSTINLGGVFNTYAFDGLVTDLDNSSQNPSGNTFNLTGTLDNSAADNPVNQDILALGAFGFPLNLAGGRIYGGSITTSGSDDLVATASDGTLDGVTLGGILANGTLVPGILDMTQVGGASAHVIDGLTLDGTIKLGGPAGTPYQTSLYFGTPGGTKAQTIGGKGTIQLGTQSATDSLFNMSTGTLTFGATVTIQGGLNSVFDSPYGLILNKGTIEDTDKGGVFEVFGAPALDVSGNLVYGNCLENYASGTLTGGTWEATGGGQLWLSGVTIDANAATILVSGSASGIYADRGVTSSLSSLTANAAHSKLTVQSGYTLDTLGGFSNAGTVLIGSKSLISTGTSGYAQTSGTTTVDGGLGAASFDLSGGSVTVANGGSLSTGDGDYIQSKGNTTVAAGGFLNAALFLLDGGALKGGGTVQAEVTNASSIVPQGTLTLQGDYTQTTAGLVDIAIDSSSQGDYGQLAISGSATLNGKLKVALAGGYTPAARTAFPVVTYKTLSGTFSALIGLNLGNGLLLTQQYSSAALTLTATQNASTSPQTLYWTGDAGDDDWDGPGNWSDVDPLVNNVPESVLPGPDDNVVVDLSYLTINHADVNYDLISSLTVTGQYVTLKLVAGTLDVSGSGALGVFQVDQPGDSVLLDGGVLAGARITSATTITAATTAGVLDNVELDGILDMTQTTYGFNGITYGYEGAQVQVMDGLILDGTIELGSSYASADLFLGTPGDTSAMTVTGTGTIQFNKGYAGADYLYGAGEGTLTFGPNIVIQAGKDSDILADDADGGTIDNQGTIEENASGGQLTLDLGAGVNDGSIQVGSGAAATVQGPGWTNSAGGQIAATAATLNLYDNWTNFGTISVDPSTVSLGSTVAIDPDDPSAADATWSNQGTLSIAAGSTVNVGGVMTTDQFEALVTELDANGPVVINLSGTLDNTAADNPLSGGVLALDASIGPLSLEGGEIYQGTITTSGANDLVATTQGGTLDGVTLDGTFDMTEFQGSSATVIGGLTLNGTIELGGAVNTFDYADLYFGSSSDNTPQTVAGTGSIQVGSAYYYYVAANFQYVVVYTTIYNNSNDTLTLGPNITINADGPTNTEFSPGLDIFSSDASSGGIDNQGTIQEDAELNINVNGFSNEGSIQAGSMLTIDSPNWVNDGSITGDGSSVSLNGSWTNNGTITASVNYQISLNGSWTNNGTITASGPYYDVSLGSPISVAPTDPTAASYTWTNPGTISIADGSQIDLGGVFTTDTFYGLVADLQANGESLANDTVYLTGTLDNSVADNPQSGGVLTLDASTGPLNLDGGRIYQGTITTSGSDVLVATDGGGTLDGVTLDGSLDMTANEAGGYATIIDGLTLSGTILMGAFYPHTLYFGTNNVAQTLSGTGTIQFGDGGPDVLDDVSSAPLTFGPNISMQASEDSVIESTGTGAFDNEGTIQENDGQSSNGFASMLTIEGIWVNSGSIEVSNGAILDLYGSWTNDGTITVAAGSPVGLGTPINISPTDPSAPTYAWSNQGTLSIANGNTVNLGGVFTTDSLDALNAYFEAGGQSLASFTVNLTGTLDGSAVDNPQSGGSLMLGATTGPLNLVGGRIYQGTIATDGSDDLVATDSEGTLDGVTLDGTMDMAEPYSGGSAVIIDGLTLNGTIEMGGASAYGVLYFGVTSDNVAQGVSGTGTIQCADGELVNFSNDMLTIGSGITIVGGASTAISSAWYYTYVPVPNNGSYYDYYYGGPFDLEGTIEDNASGGQLAIAADGWINGGSIEVGSGASAILTGINHEPQGDVYGAYYGNPYLPAPWTNNGTITAAAGSTLDLYGGWTNNGTITAGVGTVGLGGVANVDPTSSAAAPYAWKNTGKIVIANGSTVDLGGIITTDEYLDNFADVGVTADLVTDTVNLTGSLDSSPADNPESGGVLAISAATGPLFLDGGLIYQGTITTSGSDDLVNGPGFNLTQYTPGSPDVFYNTVFGTLDGVTLDGTFDMTQAGTLAYVMNGLTLNGTIDLGGAAGTNNNADLLFGQQYTYSPVYYASQTVGGTGTIRFGQDSAGDTLANASAGTLTFGPNVIIQGGLNSSISGNEYFYSSFGAFHVGPIDMQGTIEENAEGGTFTCGGGTTISDETPFTNYSAGTLTGGTWQVGNGGTLILDGTIAINAANIELSGASSAIYDEIYPAGNALANFTTNTTAGSFSVANGYTFTAPGAFSNAGAVVVGSGGTFTVGTSDYTQSQGATTVDGTLIAANIVLNGGTLSGTGTIQGDVTNAATVSPGDQPGTLTIQGNYTQTAAGILDIAIGGTSQYGQLAITGVATLDGILDVSFDNSFIPSAGAAFVVLTSDQLSGAFATINGLTFATGESLVAVYTSEDLDLTFGSVQQQITVTSSPQTVRELQNIASDPIELATFQATLPDTFSATVNWGDGTTQSSASSAQVWLSVSGTAIIVYGQHTYTAGGSYIPVVTLSGTSASAHATTTTINVANNVSSSATFKHSAAVHDLQKGADYGLYLSTLTVTNTGSTAISGNLVIVLSGLASESPGVTLKYATVTVGGQIDNLAITYDSAGDPTITVPKSLLSSLAKGSSLSISLYFSESSPSFILYGAELFSDPFDD